MIAKNLNSKDIEEKKSLSSPPIETSSLSYSDLFKGRILDQSEYFFLSTEQYKEVFDKGKSIDVRLAAACEFINEKQNDFNRVNKRSRPAVFSTIEKVRTGADKLIESAIKNNKEFDYKIGAHFYYISSNSLKSIATVKARQSFRSFHTAPVDFIILKSMGQKDPQIRAYIQDSANMLRKAIKLLERKEKEGLQLALYYGYLGDRLNYLGEKKESLAAIDKAIDLVQKTGRRKTFYHWVWWQTKKGKVYLTYNELGKAKEQLSIARDLGSKYPSRLARQYIRNFKNDIAYVVRYNQRQTN